MKPKSQRSVNFRGFTFPQRLHVTLDDELGEVYDLRVHGYVFVTIINESGIEDICTSGGGRLELKYIFQKIKIKQIKHMLNLCSCFQRPQLSLNYTFKGNRIQSDSSIVLKVKKEKTHSPIPQIVSNEVFLSPLQKDLQWKHTY